VSESAKVQFVGMEAVQAALRQVAQRAGDATPAMQSVSLALLRESERIFAAEGKGVGLDRDWAPLSEVTKRRRMDSALAGKRVYGKNGKELKSYSRAKAAAGLMKILQVSGKLAASVQPVSNAHEAGLTTNRKYAATMFFGAKQGQFGRDSRNHPVPWGDIPGRPFLPVRMSGSDFSLTAPAERSVLEILGHYLDPANFT